MPSPHPSPARTRTALDVLRAPGRAAALALLGVASLSAASGGACSSDAGDIFGESSAAGPTSGPGGDGGQGDGGAGPVVAATGTTTGSSSTSSVGSTGEGPSGTTVTTGDGGSSSDGGAGPTSTTSGDGGGAVTTEAGPTSTVAGAMCSDGEANGDEQCDGDDLAGATCGSLGFQGNGTLGCTDACTYDETGCVKCGNGEVDNGEDCDDGGVEPDDGCDANCHFEGTGCNDLIDVAIGLGDSVSISTTNEEGAPAPNTCSSATGPGRVFRVESDDEGFLTAWVRRDGTTLDTTLRVTNSCTNPTAQTCADSYAPDVEAQPAGGEVISVKVEAGVPVFVFVEAWELDTVGDFTVEMTLARGRCDDPVVIPVETGSSEGIVMTGSNAGEGGDERGECGFQTGAGNGEEVSYELVAIDGATPVDVRLDPLEGSLYNPVLHARIGACDEVADEVACGVAGGFGQPEEIDGLDVDPRAFLHADAAQGSVGRYRIRVTPPVP